jgi:hypothetical protein
MTLSQPDPMDGDAADIAQVGLPQIYDDDA